MNLENKDIDSYLNILSPTKNISINNRKISIVKENYVSTKNNYLSFNKKYVNSKKIEEDSFRKGFDRKLPDTFPLSIQKDQSRK